jgi:hypothetical protein
VPQPGGWGMASLADGEDQRSPAFDRVGIERSQSFEARPHMLEEFLAERLAVRRVVGAVEAAETCVQPGLVDLPESRSHARQSAAGRYPAKVEESSSSISGCEPNTA